MHTCSRAAAPCVFCPASARSDWRWSSAHFRPSALFASEEKRWCSFRNAIACSTSLVFLQRRRFFLGRSRLPRSGWVGSLKRGSAPRACESSANFELSEKGKEASERKPPFVDTRPRPNFARGEKSLLAELSRRRITRSRCNRSRLYIRTTSLSLHLALINDTFCHWFTAFLLALSLLFLFSPLCGSVFERAGLFFDSPSPRLLVGALVERRKFGRCAVKSAPTRFTEFSTVVTKSDHLA